MCGPAAGLGQLRASERIQRLSLPAAVSAEAPHQRWLPWLPPWVLQGLAHVQVEASVTQPEKRLRWVHHPEGCTL